LTPQISTLFIIKTPLPLTLFFLTLELFTFRCVNILAPLKVKKTGKFFARLFFIIFIQFHYDRTEITEE
jgi:hypothetical protein